ncbi:MAG TPA: aromatic ring-hydroxylating dioxygenase subunit alpha, partial [Alphaproteobacteria bacterium]
AAQLPNPGDTLARDIAGRPIFVIRNREGDLRAFLNICRHRAARLVPEGAAHCDVLRCPYHGWLYDAEGRLKAMPEFGEAPELDKSKLGLVAVRVAEWRGLVFVTLDRNPSTVEEGLGDLVRVAERFPLERFEWQDRTVYELDFNWKNYVDNYMEGYHIPYLHPGLNRETEAKAYTVTPGDRVCIHRAPTRTGATYDGLWLWRWPNITIGIYGDGLNITRIVPHGPSQMALEIDFFFLPDAKADAEDRRRKMQWTREVVEEDFAMCRAVQRNLEGGHYETGPLSPRHENGVAYFHDLVRRALAPELTDQEPR